MLDKLFNSTTRVKILALFFSNIDKKLYTQEIIKLSKTDAANAHRELIKLKKIGVLNSEKKGNLKYYHLDQNFDYFKGLKGLLETYNKLNTKDKFFLMEEVPGYFPMIVFSAWSTKWGNEFLKSRGLKNGITRLLDVYDNGSCLIYAQKDEFDEISHEIIEKMIEDPDWARQYTKEVINGSEKLFKQSEKLFKINLASLSNIELYQLYEEYYQYYKELHVYHWVQTCADFGDNLFSRYLMNYLKSVIKDSKNKKYSIGDVFATITTPTVESYTSKEYRDLLEILDHIIQNKDLKKYLKNTETRIIADELKKINVELNDRIGEHAKSYGWLGYGATGPGWDKSYFIDILTSLVRQNSDPKKLLAKEKNDKENTVKKQKLFIEGLKIDKKHANLFSTARDIIHSKGIRKDSMFYNWSAMENLYREIGKRFYLSLNQVRFFYPYEFKDLLLKGKFSAKVLNARYKKSLHYSSVKEGEIVLEGQECDDLLKTFSFIKENIENVKILIGDCASSGQVRGEVVIVNTVADMEKVKEGNILISTATNPDLVPAIKKSAAIVTDVGGITCHAAIISRELGIPCVTGTRIATKVLKDGYLVDVHATHGKVTIIKK